MLGTDQPPHITPLSEAPDSARGAHFLITLQTSAPESGTSPLQLFSVTVIFIMQTEPQTQHPQLLLSYDTLCSKFPFPVLFPLITFRLSSPHHLIKARGFCRLIQLSSLHSLQQCKTKRGTVKNRGAFHSQDAQSLTSCSSH